MISRWKSLPKELVDKIMLYQPIESPAMMAWDTAEIREITNNELWCKVDGDIELYTTDSDSEDEAAEALNIEWFHFLITQHYGIGIWEEDEQITND